MSTETSETRTVLVCGASGVVGFAAARQFTAAGWNVIGLSRRVPPRFADTPHVAVDLADLDSVRAVASQLTDVTHVVFAALFEKPGLVRGWFEQDQMDRNLAMISNLFTVLDGVAKVQHVSLLQGTKAYGAHVEPMKVPGRERNPRHNHANFYWLQEDFLRARQDAGHRATFTIVRPQVIYGEAQGGNMNITPALGVYAALLRASGQPLHWPGGVSSVSEAVDADLLGRMLVWAATAQTAVNETFNFTNGDVYTLQNCWPAIADAFGMEVGDDQPLALAESMPAREDEWAALVDQLSLDAPRSLEAFVGQSFIYADLMTGFGRTELRPPSLVSTIKLRQAGFAECLDTEDMFRQQIGAMQAAKLFPR
ncbi:MAG: nucleoside-diphosphate-sugar epimerase [Candidatus Poriferisodalaceae bacterium]|jgi:nucleoside-diphosphate-sugar epimerase